MVKINQKNYLYLKNYKSRTVYEYCILFTMFQQYLIISLIFYKHIISCYLFFIQIKALINIQKMPVKGLFSDAPRHKTYW